MKRVVFLDRDGTLVHTFPQDGLPVRGPRTPQEVQYLPGVADGCDRLRRAGFLLVCVTNQPDIGRGIIDDHSLFSVNSVIGTALRIPYWLVCRHTADDNCSCRKPKPGLLYAAAYLHNIDLSQSWMIGDRSTDNAAAAAAHVRFVGVNPNSFLEAVQCILTT